MNQSFWLQGTKFFIPEIEIIRGSRNVQGTEISKDMLNDEKYSLSFGKTIDALCTHYFEQKCIARSTPWIVVIILYVCINILIPFFNDSKVESLVTDNSDVLQKEQKRKTIWFIFPRRCD